MSGYANTPGDLDHVEIRCTVADIDLCIQLLGAWVCEGEQSPPKWFALTRTASAISLSAGKSSHVVTVTMDRLDIIDERRSLSIAAISMAHAFACRAGEVPSTITGTVHYERTGLNRR
jgi:hypothetical protein